MISIMTAGLYAQVDTGKDKSGGGWFIDIDQSLI
jgi:hypothetical protein